MARLFTCGFEENNITAGITMWSAINGGAQAPTVINATAPTSHSGDYYMSTNAAANQSNITRNFPSTKASGTLYTRFYFKVDDATPSVNARVMEWTNNAGVAQTTVTLLTTGELEVTNVAVPTTVATTVQLSAATWYRIETKVVIGASGSTELRLYVGDSTTLLDSAATGTENTGVTFFSLRLGKIVVLHSTSTLSYDDVAINDESGASQNDWIGVGKMYLLVPNSDVSITWEDQIPGTATFANIDDLPGTPSDTEYNTEIVTLNSIDQFGMTNLGAEVPADATITLIDIYGRVGSTQTAATNMRFKIWDESATLTNGPTCNANVNGWKMVTTAEHLAYPATGKTKANIDSFNMGYENITDVATRERRVSALWANVEWTEAVASITTEYVGPVAMQRQGGVMIGRRYV